MSWAERRRQRHKEAKALVLEAVRQGHTWGYDICKATGLRPGRMYPAVHELYDEGVLRDEWEDTGGKYPRRRYYFVND